MSPHSPNTAAQWFHATEALGDFMGIRYGRIPHGSTEPEWHHVSHVECDGIGGFARLLRQHGATLPELPISKTHSRATIGPIWKLWQKTRKSPPCAQRSRWLHKYTPQSGPPKELAWHLFSELETKQFLSSCRHHQVTANTLLLRHLDTSIRQDLNLTDARLAWMVPVNMRSISKTTPDTANQVSCIDAHIAPDDSLQCLHQQILQRLADGEHRANFLLMELGKFLSHHRKMRILARSRTKPSGNVGVFSNLGSWDSHQKIPSTDSWLFCPPLVTGQRLAAGSVTFQNRMGLVLQTHPDATHKDHATQWIQRWVETISNDNR